MFYVDKQLINSGQELIQFHSIATLVSFQYHLTQSYLLHEGTGRI